MGALGVVKPFISAILAGGPARPPPEGASARPARPFLRRSPAGPLPWRSTRRPGTTPDATLGGLAGREDAGAAGEVGDDARVDEAGGGGEAGGLVEVALEKLAGQRAAGAQGTRGPGDESRGLNSAKDVR